MSDGVSPRFKARIAGVFYLITFVGGSLALVGQRTAANLIADAAYIGVTLLFYGLFKPVNRGVSLLAALFSLAGIAIGALTQLRVFLNFPINNLAIFGFYCLLIGYLIFKSTFLPRALGVLMALGGLSWLTFLSPSLAKSLSPYNFFPGILAEGLLTLWLLVFGLNERRWNARAAPRNANHSPVQPNHEGAF
jgi:hypothetical protein